MTASQMGRYDGLAGDIGSQVRWELDEKRKRRHSF